MVLQWSSCLLLLALLPCSTADECYPDCYKGHGVCISGKCFCRSPWVGDDCSQTPGQRKARNASHRGASKVAAGGAPKVAVGASDLGPSADDLISPGDAQVRDIIAQSPLSQLVQVQDVVVGSPLSELERKSQASPSEEWKSEAVPPAAPSLTEDAALLGQAPAAEAPPSSPAAPVRFDRHVETPRRIQTAQVVDTARSPMRRNQLTNRPADRNVFHARFENIARSTWSTRSTSPLHTFDALPQQHNLQLRTSNMFLRSGRQKTHIDSHYSDKGSNTDQQKLAQLAQSFEKRLRGTSDKEDGDTASEAAEKSFNKYCPFLLFGIELFVILCLGCCAGVGYAAGLNENDGLEAPWWTGPCLDASQCCCVLLVDDYRISIMIVVFLLMINGAWYVLCYFGFIWQFMPEAAVSIFLVVFAAGLLSMGLCMMRNRIHQNWYYQKMQSNIQNIEAITTFLQARGGKQFYSAMKKSGNFSQEQLAGMKGEMKGSGAWVAAKSDDIGDFLGLGECSSEDDYTLGDATRNKIAEFREGRKFTDEERKKRNFERRSEAEKEQILAKKHVKAKKQASTMSTSLGSMFGKQVDSADDAGVKSEEEAPKSKKSGCC